MIVDCKPACLYYSVWLLRFDPPKSSEKKPVMRKTISTQELKTHVGEIVDSVRLRGDRYIIERRGKPVAAVVPVHIEDQYDRSRRDFFELIDRVHEKNRDVPPAEMEEAIDQAVREVRREKSKRGKRA